MAFSLSSILKKNDGPTVEFRGKMIQYSLTEEDGVYTFHLGHDGKLKNSWNDKVWIRTVYDTNTGKITCYATKAEASIHDGKILFANYEALLFPEFFPITAEEKQWFVDFMINAASKTE